MCVRRVNFISTKKKIAKFEREREREGGTNSFWSVVIVDFELLLAPNSWVCDVELQNKKEYNHHVGCERIGRSGANAAANEDDTKRKRSLCFL